MHSTQAEARKSQGMNGVRKVAREGSRNGSPLRSTIGASHYGAIASTHFSVRLRRGGWRDMARV
jgi:hypothetical protein